MPTVFITGANRGLGLEFVKQYVNDGWRVIAMQRSRSDALAAYEDRIETVFCDLTNDNDLRASLAPYVDDCIDVLINNAGTMGKLSFGEAGQAAQAFGSFDRAEWASVFDINVSTPMAMTEILVDAVARSERGRIVAVSSMLGSMTLNTAGGLYGYRASKAALNAIVRSLAIDLSGRGIVVAGLHPGWVRTEMGGEDAHLSASESVTGLRRVIERLTPETAGLVTAWDGTNVPW
ncbi:MAG: SDR family oxidoreductase [Woeseiaceae bacterium]